MLKIICILIISSILCETVTWYGNKDTYWYNINNWNPKLIPTINDDVIISYNASIPPYSDKTIFVNKLYNYLIIDLYKTIANINTLVNYGQINLYNSTLNIKNCMYITGHIDIVESTVNCPLIKMNNGSLIHGSGIIHGIVNNILGQLIIYQNSNLYINKYVQLNNATLSYSLNNNTLITDSLYLTGVLKVYQPGLINNITTTIIKSYYDMIVENISIVVCNQETKGKLIVNNTSRTIEIFLKKNNKLY